MSTVFLGMDFAKEKFTHRVVGWRRVSSYKQRQVFREKEHVDLVKYDVPAALPANKGKKILWFSDLHFRGEEEVLAESLELIAEVQPDYIIYGGDVVTFSSLLPRVRTFLQSLPEKSKKIAVLGNWEYSKRWLDHQDWREFFDNSGFELLINASCESGDFFFYGTDDLRRGKTAKPKEVPDGKEIVFLAHSPDAFVGISSNKILAKSSLVMCGHTHGGQIRFPFLGALLTSSRYWRRFDYGNFVYRQKCNMIVSSGLGCSTIPFRMSCRRELVLVDFI